MKKIYDPCPYCFKKITAEPKFEKHQGRYSVLCPHCFSHRSEWVETIEEAILSWNVYLREENDIYYIPSLAPKVPKVIPKPISIKDVQIHKQLIPV